MNKKGEVFLLAKNEKTPTGNQRTQPQLISYDIQTGKKAPFVPEKGGQDEDQQFIYSKKL